ncbi:cache domain-containing sensor histidine kinase [Paenibacillus qinlingensis]|uniref:cache domain-containing sensor histidine kinase n=1 Tax=Paenibacillus qinlingensis TaxID=1837343 RepID=UPI0015659F56|nr:sensor histidine kinase [Paenibacillus qinlingensis]NQX63664.1 histidine kinase [Paenibacillus qinlingensis]
MPTRANRLHFLFTSIGTKLFLITFFSFLLGLLLVGGIAFYNNSAIIKQNQEESLQLLMGQVEGYLQIHMTAIQENLLFLTDKEIYDSLALTDYQVLMENMVKLHPDTIKSIYLIVDGEYSISAPQSMKYFVNKEQMVEVYNQARLWGFWWSQPYISSFSKKTITAAKTIESSTVKGVIAIDLNVDNLASSLTVPTLKKRMDLYLLSRTGELISTNTPMTFEEKTNGDHPMVHMLKDKVKSNDLEFDHVDLPDGRYKILKSNRNRWDWVVFAAINEMEVYEILQVVKKQYVLMLSLWILVSLAISYWLGRYFRAPIKEISRQMNYGALGNLEHRIDMKRMDEFSYVVSGYNKLMDRIGTLFKDLQLMEDQKRYHELKVLQSQINPHFLYNALNTIYCLVETERVKEIGSVIQSLVGILRFSIDKIDEVVLLKFEVECVWKYVDLMKLRFGDIFDMDIIIPEPFEQAYIPKLTLLTLIENSIFYGLNKPGERNHIIIMAYEEQPGIICFEVSDTGPGIDEEMIRRLIVKEVSNEFLKDSSLVDRPDKERKGLNNLGIRNIHERIQLHFGKQFGLDIESSLGEGTRVMVRLPFKSAERNSRQIEMGQRRDAN